MKDYSWRDQLSRRLTSAADLPPGFRLSANERRFFETDQKLRVLPFNVTPYYFSLADPRDPRCPVRRQVMPTDLEFLHKPYESDDPLCEAGYTVGPGMVRRYRDRCALKVTDRCAAHCRFCFRRYFTGAAKSMLTTGQVKRAALYLAKHPEISELLLTGGDPLVLGDGMLKMILGVIRGKNPGLVLRICTRTPAVLPQRITPELCALLAGNTPLWVITHFNHPKEITPESSAALERLVDTGIPVLNQTVLLKGVNDSEQTLARLFRAMAALRVKPYYLFQGDLVKGTSHFRTNLARGIGLMRRLSRRVSGICLPRYAVDLPGGGGKMLLERLDVKRVERGFYIIDNYAKKLYKYPKE